MIARYESWKVLKRRQRGTTRVPLSLLTPHAFRPLSTADLPLIFLCHNDLALLPAFFRHYRSLGVTRFIVVDDQSSDGSREWLAAQVDTDLWTSTVRYKEAKRGRIWREMLLHLYGHDRWYLNVDADEFLVFDQCDTQPLLALIQVLTGEGNVKMPAPMLDLYPRGGLDYVHAANCGDSMPWEVADAFDAFGYKLSVKKRFMSLRGGPRERMFRSEAELMKYPLLFWSKDSSLGSSIHQPLPYGENFGPISGVLLHFKFFADVKERVAEAVSDGQYFNGAQEYRRILEHLEKDDVLNFTSSATTVYEGPAQLVARGFMRKLF
ncbi:glycosyltransferase family 2 protein [Rhizobium glycinendophyticum]|uniref:Glycosyltransferase family 2 protein n=1 Tax=Rhizobium glycinendophyticum TaxID=2589807 RepID=A0A504UU48_9HYPH|nr:glycosyltransferase family 2 protein [Rhizobium glycinendophyticum]